MTNLNPAAICGATDDALIANADIAEIARLRAALERAEVDAAALRACLADTLGFTWKINRVEQQKSSVDVRRRANELIATAHPGRALLAELDATRVYLAYVLETYPPTSAREAALRAAYDAAVKAREG